MRGVGINCITNNLDDHFVDMCPDILCAGRAATGIPTPRRERAQRQRTAQALSQVTPRHLCGHRTIARLIVKSAKRRERAFQTRVES